jgi:DNA-directed RNA polymerase subunit M/transcription elongation factor TFIIS
MFCPTCGELAYFRDGNGDVKTYYERVVSSVNPGFVWWQEDEPFLENYNPDGSRKGNEQGLSKRRTARRKPPRRTRKKTDFEIDYDEWRSLREEIDPYTIVKKGKELEKNGVKYAQCKNYLCKYHGPAKKIKIGEKEIGFDDFNTSVEIDTREYIPIPDSSTASRIKTTSYNCPKCSCSKAYIDPQRIEFGEVPVISLECTECGHGWRES